MSRLAPAHFAKLATLVLFGACDGGTSPTGSWPLSNLQLLDVAGNTRSYFRRATDGFLCTGSPQVCQDVGDTEVIVQTN